MGQYHPPGFAEWSSPEWTVISGSEGDRSEAAKTAYSRGSQVLHTAIAAPCMSVSPPARFQSIAGMRMNGSFIARAESLSADGNYWPDVDVS